MDREIEQLIVWALILLVGIIFFIPGILGFTIYAVLQAFKKEKITIYVGAAGILTLIIVFATGHILSYFAQFSSLHIALISKLLAQHSIRLNVYTYLITFSLGMVFSLGLFLFFKVFWKKPISSKQEKIRKKKASQKYKKFRDKRMEFSEKQQLKYRQSDSKGDVFLGYTDDKERVEIPEKEFNYHGLLLGGTGTGKTTIIACIMEAALRITKPIIFVDGKGERKSMLEFKKLCEAYGKKVYMFSEYDSYTYNPIKWGTATEIRDKIMNLFDWSEPFYKNFCSRYLQLVVKLIRATDSEQDLYTVLKLLNFDNVKRLFMSCYEEEEIEEEIEVNAENTDSSMNAEDDDPFAAINAVVQVKTKTKEIKKEKRIIRKLRPDLQELLDKFAEYENEDSFKNLTGLRTQLGELLESDLGHLFKNSDREIDLRNITDEGNVVIFSVSGNRYRDYIKRLGKIITLDVNSLGAFRQETGRKKTLCIFDEFSAYGNGEIVDIVNKLRSAGFECIISTQTISDLEAVEPFLTNRIIANCNILASGRVNTPDDAEKIAKLFSTFQDSEITSQIERKNNFLKTTADMGTVRTVEAFVAHPNEIKSAQIGEVFLARKMKEERVGMTYTRRVYVRNALDLEGIPKRQDPKVDLKKKDQKLLQGVPKVIYLPAPKEEKIKINH